ncbi:MAG: hypothetical protein CMH54_07325 [Myxococcales bacterium]|nr:hypothetical protein [Myxococcales bacterium]|tara:strand:- start:603 stop:896 length:294 start_codon:yes stop_codon:yes gene_type:complete
MAMFVAVCSLELGLYEVTSLKEKRSIVKRIIRRTQDRFRVAMNEVGALDDLGRAEIGIALIGNDQSILNSVLDRLIQSVEKLHLADVVAVDFTIEAY